MLNILILVGSSILGIIIGTLINVLIIKNNKFEKIFKVVKLFFLCLALALFLKLEVQKTVYMGGLGFLVGLTFGFPSNIKMNKKD